MTSTIPTLRRQLALVFFALVLTLLFSTPPVLAQCGTISKYMPPPDKIGCSKGGLNYAIYGTTGAPLLAIHGLGGSMYSWREFVKTKDTFPGYQIILIDLLGAGNSLKPRNGKYKILQQRDLVYDFIVNELKLTNLTLVGNSYGGAVSLVLTLKLMKVNAGLLEKLILIDSGGYNKLLPWYLKLLRTPVLGWLALRILTPSEAADTVLKNAYYDDRLITKEQIAAYAEPIGARGGRRALLKTAQGVIPKRINTITAKYRTIDLPTLILWGGDDEVIPLEIGEMLHSAIKTSDLQLINECGHIPQEEKPAETICRMRKFLGLPTTGCPL